MLTKWRGKLKSIQTKGDLAILSKPLQRFILTHPSEFNHEHYLIEQFDKDALLEVFKELEFKTWRIIFYRLTLIKGKLPSNTPQTKN